MNIYKNHPDFLVVTCFFNPIGYATKRLNYNLFIESMERSEVQYIVVECIFPGQKFTLPDSKRVIRMYSNSVMWQKERLVNLAVSFLPKSTKYVGWIDCDLLFANQDWILNAVALMEQDFPVVQLYEQLVRLPAGQRVYRGEGKISKSFASVVAKNPEVLGPGSTLKHGFTGGAWAAQRELFDSCGLYEYAVVGGADDYTAHALFGDFNSLCLKDKMCGNENIIRHYLEWAEPLFSRVNGKVSFVSGSVFHLWHGDVENRKYVNRHLKLCQLGYDPFRHLVGMPGKPLEWSPDTPVELRKWILEYFLNRKEDG